MPAREVIFNNFWQKIFSLILATLIWLTIDRAYLSELRSPNTSMRPEVVKDLRCPIEIRTSASAPQTFKVDPSEVDVTISGERKIIENIKPEDIKVFVDLSNIDPSKISPGYQHPVELILPRGITASAVVPFVTVTVNDL